jgi:aminoglycoside phosphotransferase (APT) family kinase protein
VHDNEIVTSVEQVGRLVAQQFPQWAGLPIQRLPIGGTDHTLYRIGDDLVARMPRIAWASGSADSDLRWLPHLAPHLPLRVPTPVAVGEPGEGFPFRWAVVPWLTGTNPTADNTDLAEAALTLAGFITALQGIDPTGAPASSRGMPLAERDEATRAAITELGSRIDRPRVTALWEQALAADDWSRAPVWMHGDLSAGNLLVRQRKLVGVIDWGATGIGDPAVDLMPAWSLFDPASRQVFREALGCDEDTWQRGRGWALSTALIALPYYWERYPGIVAESHAKIAAVVADAAD